MPLHQHTLLVAGATQSRAGRESSSGAAEAAVAPFARHSRSATVFASSQVEDLFIVFLKLGCSEASSRSCRLGLVRVPSWELWYVD